MTICVVHSHTIPNGIPSPEGQVRLDYAASILGTNPDGIPNRVEKILLVGGRATRGIDAIHSEVARQYLRDRGVDDKKLIIEEDIPGRGDSRETAGETIFGRAQHGDLLDQYPLLLVSSDYHERRLREIYKLVHGKRDDIYFQGMKGFTREEEGEQKSLDAFQTTFANVPVGIDAILERLWRYHGAYKDHPSNPYKNLSPE